MSASIQEVERIGFLFSFRMTMMQLNIVVKYTTVIVRFIHQLKMCILKLFVWMLAQILTCCQFELVIPFAAELGC